MIEDAVEAVKRLQQKETQLQKWRDYYNNEQPDIYDQDAWAEAMESTPQPREPLCSLATDTLVYRQRSSGFTARTDDPDDIAGAEEAQAIFARNGGDAIIDELARELSITKEASLIVGINSSGQALLLPQRAEEMVVDYDPEYPGERVKSVRVWRDGKLVRVTIHYQTYTERWVTKEAKWDSGWPTEQEFFQQYVPPVRSLTTPGSSTVAQASLESVQPNAFNTVPTFQAKLHQSDLQPLIPMQDQLHKGLADLAILQDAAGFPWRVIIGAEVGSTRPDAPAFDTPVPFALATDSGTTTTTTEVTAETEEEALESSPRRALILPEGASADQFPAADLASSIAACDSYRLAICRLGSIPLHLALLGNGAPPSGRALETAEAPLIDKVSSRNRILGRMLADALAFAVQLERSHNADGSFSGTVARRPLLTAQWESPATQQGMDLAEKIGLLVQMNVRPSTILVDEFGWSEQKALEEEAAIAKASVTEAGLTAELFRRGNAVGATA